MNLTDIINTINAIVWNNLLAVLCLLAGLFFSIMLGFPQIRHFREMVRLLMDQESKGKQGISSFQAFATTVGSRVGMGSVAGVATGIYFGGPGAIFWIWVLGILGSVSAFAESTLAQAYKNKVGSEYVGGPALYIEKGLKCRPYAYAFAFASILGPGILMPGLQVNSLASTFGSAFGVGKTAIGIALALLIGAVTFGGVKRIGSFAEKATPFMCGIYMLMAVGIMAIYWKNIPSVLYDIVSSAFGVNSVFGGIVGSAILWGVKRGVYSTEAGQGNGAILSGAAECTHPVKQGLIQALSVYIVAFIVCTSTAVILLLSNSYNVIGPDGTSFIVEHLPGKEYGVVWTQSILESTYGTFIGGKIFSLIIALFIFTSIVGYSYQSESNVNYLFGGSRTAINIMRVIFIIASCSGVVITSETVWTLGDIGAGLMAWLNIIAILLMSKQVRAMLKDYEKQKGLGLDPVFKPEDFGIEDLTGAWRTDREAADVITQAVIQEIQENVD